MSWQSLIGVPQCADCCDLMGRIPDGAVNLVFADPDYNIGIFRKMPPDEYLAWCEEWIAEASRVLAANGALWVSHSKPLVLARISEIVSKYGRGLINWVTWDKYNGAPDEPFGIKDTMNCTKLHPQGKRSFDQDAEYLIYHADEGDWTAQCDREQGFIFEPLRAYLADEWRRAGLTPKDANIATSTQMSGHYLTRVQWALPTRERYEQLRTYANNHNHGSEYLRRDYEYLRRDYEHLRREYEDLRYTFNNPGKVSSVWQVPPAPRTWHPTPKPEALLERIILTTSNEGDLMLDPFGGSFTTARVCQRLGRRWISGDINPEYVERARVELSQTAMELSGCST